MNHPTSTVHGLAGGAHRGEELLGWGAGLGFTLVLFLGLAQIEHTGPARPAVEIDDLRMVSLPLETPPPPPRTIEPPPPETMPAFAGLDVAASDSSVRIAVVPPDLEALLPTTREPPRALIQPGYLHSEFKPRLDTDAGVRHLYQVSEVDQPPQAVVRVAPSVPLELYGAARSLMVVLLVVIEPDGRVANVRIAQSSGQPIFDDAVVENVKTTWEFTPAVRRGKKVKCLVQQACRVNIGRTSPFETR